MARVVEKAERLPRECAVTGRSKGPFVDFQVDVHPPSPNQPHNLYIHKAILEQIAKKQLGMVPKAEVDEMQEQLRALGDQLAEMRGFMETFAEFEQKFEQFKSERSN